MTKDILTASVITHRGSYRLRTATMCYSFKWTPHSQWLCRMLWLMAVTCNKAMNVVLGVSDMYCVHADKNKLLSIIPSMRDKLASLGLSLNEKKFYLQHYKKGVEFTGAIVKPGRVYCCNRTLTNFIAAVHRLNKAKTLREVRHSVCSINSYLGLLRHSNEYASRRKILNMIDSRLYEYLYIKGHHEVLVLKKRYRTRELTLKRIRDGDY